MTKYCVNKGGDHEVHKIIACTSLRLPNQSNRVDFEAMQKAKRIYSNADGCAYCMPDYHKR